MINSEYLKPFGITLKPYWKKMLLAASCAGLAAFGIQVAIQNYQNHSNFVAGEDAYKLADCGTAIGHLNKISMRNVPFHNNQYFEAAQPKIEECKALQSFIVHITDKKYTSALRSAAKFIDSFKENHLTALVYVRSADIFNENPVEAIVGFSFCPQIEMFSRYNLIPQPDENLPLLHFACGEYYKQEKSYNLAIPSYQFFLDNYPQHSLLSNAKAAMASIAIDLAKSAKTVEIDMPQKIGKSAPGTVTIIIQNDAPDTLDVTFSGPNTLLETIEDCPDCQVLTQAPKYCPEKGPIKEYTIAPGDYDVLFESPKSSDVTPMLGEWQLEDGAKYYMCSIVVKKKVNDISDVFKPVAEQP